MKGPSASGLFYKYQFVNFKHKFTKEEAFIYSLKETKLVPHRPFLTFKVLNRYPRIVFCLLEWVESVFDLDLV